MSARDEDVRIGVARDDVFEVDCSEFEFPPELANARIMSDGVVYSLDGKRMGRVVFPPDSELRPKAQSTSRPQQTSSPSTPTSRLGASRDIAGSVGRRGSTNTTPRRHVERRVSIGSGVAAETGSFVKDSFGRDRENSRIESNFPSSPPTNDGNNSTRRQMAVGSVMRNGGGEDFFDEEEEESYFAGASTRGRGVSVVADAVPIQFLDSSRVEIDMPRLPFNFPPGTIITSDGNVWTGVDKQWLGKIDLPMRMGRILNARRILIKSLHTAT
jgi:hypothetical protein